VVAEGRSGLQRQLAVLEDGQLFEQAGDLKRARDALAGDAIRRELAHVVPEDGHPASRGLEEAGEHVEQRGLAGAVWPDERMNGALLHPQVHAVHRPEATELLGEPVRLQHAHGWALY
jgi:hypothetical protein